MKRYTLYCTLEQTMKALELGAPIDIEDYEPRLACIIPTAEQMIGWLEACYNDTDITIERYSNGRWMYFIGWQSSGYYESRQEATLAAIDAALGQIMKVKEEKKWKQKN